MATQRIRKNLYTHLIAGRKRHEVDLRRRDGIVSEGSLDRREIVRSDGGQHTPPTDVLVELILQNKTTYI